MPKCLLIADDLTGTVDASAPAVREDWQVQLHTNIYEASFAEASASQVAVNINSRHSPPAEASLRINRVVDAFGDTLPPIIYKKTDSVLRGNIAAELKALAERLPERPLYYVPAMPEAGRTLRDGILYVEAVPVAQTAFAQDPESPVTQSSAVELLRPAFGDALEHVPLEAIRAGAFPETMGGQCVVFDGETQGDLKRVADWIKQRRKPLLLAGPGGLAKYLPEIAGSLAAPPVLSWSVPNIVVSGSMHPHSQAQLDHARQQGAQEIIVELDESARPAMPSAQEALNAGSCMLIHTGSRRSLNAAQHAKLGKHLAKTAAGMIRQMGYADCIVFGGQTAAYLVEELGLNQAEVVGSPHPGMGIMRFRVADAPNQTFTLTTKSGGMGPLTLLQRHG